MISDDFDDDNPVVETGNPSGSVQGGTTMNRCDNEVRRICQLQDEEYEQMLRDDRAKVTYIIMW